MRHALTIRQTLRGTFYAHQSPVAAPSTPIDSAPNCTGRFDRTEIIADALIVRYDNDSENGKWINITFRRHRPAADGQCRVLRRESG